MSCSNSNLTSGFIDIATASELEKFIYSGPDAIAYFVRATKKSTWFTQVPVCLSRACGIPQFGADWSVSISRAGDYLLHSWLRVTIPEITTSEAFNMNEDLRIRWTKNLMHNLLCECSITFNDLVAARFDSYHLDFWSAFTVPASKRVGYDNMIGNFSSMTDPQTKGIKSQILNLPLPFFFTRDSGTALPTAALPYNDVRINFSFRPWELLLIVDDLSVVGTGMEAAVAQTKNTTARPGPFSRPAIASDLYGSNGPVITQANCWANYAIVSNDERKRMACAPRDILIEQIQTAPLQTFNPANNVSPTLDQRFSHSVKLLLFGVRNTTVKSSWSVYTSGTPVPLSTCMDYGAASLTDPIASASLIYENTSRLSNMGSDYFSLVAPWYHAPSIPAETGYHMYSYSLDFFNVDPMGSTNYGKLTNVSINIQASEDSIACSSGNLSVFPHTQLNERANGGNFKQTYSFVSMVVSNNYVRIAGGALGFPVL